MDGTYGHRPIPSAGEAPGEVHSEPEGFHGEGIGADQRDGQPTYLFVASEVRSGSTYVAELLAYSLFASGRGEAWGLTMEHFRHIDDLSTPEQVSGGLAGLWRSPEQLCATKLMASQLSVLTRCARADQDLCDLVFGQRAKWFVVRRRNKIGQAVSLAVARKTDQWHNYREIREECAIDVSIADIQSALKAVILSDCYLESFLSLPATCVELFYEDVIADPKQSIRDALTKAGLLSDPAAFRFGDSKLVPDRQAEKANLEAAFRHWLLENNHTIHSPATVRAPCSVCGFDGHGLG